MKVSILPKIFLVTSIMLLHFSSSLNGQESEKIDISGSKDLTIMFGGAGDALDYSIDHNVIVITIITGTETPHSPETIARAIKKNIFSGYEEAPIAVFIYSKPTEGKAGIALIVYIRGHRFRDQYTGINVLDAADLRKCAGQIVNKFKNPARRIDEKNALSVDH